MSDCEVSESRVHEIKLRSMWQVSRRFFFSMFDAIDLNARPFGETRDTRSPMSRRSADPATSINHNLNARAACAPRPQNEHSTEHTRRSNATHVARAETVRNAPRWRRTTRSEHSSLRREDSISRVSVRASKTQNRATAPSPAEGAETLNVDGNSHRRAWSPLLGRGR